MRSIQRRLTVLVVVLAASGSAVACASTWQLGLSTSAAGQARSASTPAAPTGVAATCVASSQNKVTVTWGAVTRATSYTLYYSITSSSSGFFVAATGLTGTSWSSPSLSSGRTYWFQVSASVGSNWVSPNSASTVGRQIRSSNPICS
jgi:hypothetical protein